MSKEIEQLFREALAWGCVYGPLLVPKQWEEMRDKMAMQFAERLRNLPDSSGVNPGELK